MSYSPRSLVLTLSRQCNLRCGHCIVEAEPRERERLDSGLITHILGQAKSIGINSVILYGGEPLLRSRDLLPETLHKVLAEGFPVSIGTNGFWGRTESQADKVLSDLEQVTARHDGFMSLGLSVDKYHQPSVPPKSIANIITRYRLGNFPHIRLGIQSFRDDKSWRVIGEVFESCKENGINLIESNDSAYLYPALENEIIEHTQNNFPFIAKKLDLPLNVSEEVILNILYNLLSFTDGLRDLVKPKVIARNFDLGKGMTNYLIFPDPQYLMDNFSEKVISAGRAREGKELEMGFHYEHSVDYLVIAPNGQAYAYPAQITAEEGVYIGNRSLNDVVFEVGRRITQ